MVIGQGHISAESSVNGLMFFLALTIKKMVIFWRSKKAFTLFEHSLLLHNEQPQYVITEVSTNLICM